MAGTVDLTVRFQLFDKEAHHIVDFRCGENLVVVHIAGGEILHRFRTVFRRQTSERVGRFVKRTVDFFFLADKADVRACGRTVETEKVALEKERSRHRKIVVFPAQKAGDGQAYLAVARHGDVRRGFSAGTAEAQHIRRESEATDDTDDGVETFGTAVGDVRDPLFVSFVFHEIRLRSVKDENFPHPQ